MLTVLRNNEEAIEVRLAVLQSLQAASFSVLAFESCRGDYIATLREIADDPDPELRQRVHGLLAREKDGFAQKRLIEGPRNTLKAARPERGKWLHNMRLKFNAGDLVNPDNRAELVDDEPHIEWAGHSNYSRSGFDHATAETRSLLPFDHEVVDIDDTSTEGHIQGMTRMALRPQDGVVDPNCKVFGVSNL